jgi:hypothetical protein
VRQHLPNGNDGYPQQADVSESSRRRHSNVSSNLIGLRFCGDLAFNQKRPTLFIVDPPVRKASAFFLFGSGDIFRLTWQRLLQYEKSPAWTAAGVSPANEFPKKPGVGLQTC